jgi:parallel beta-helix repeat protein
VIAGVGVVTLLAALASASGASARRTSVISVPNDYPSIQQAINAATDGDDVLVSPGTYHERINYGSKAITVESTGGPATTVIQGDGTAVVAVLPTPAGQTQVLRGFTITGGGGVSQDGGVDTGGGSALIEDNWIVGNHFCDGGAVEAAFSAATIRGNLIWRNSQSGCTGGSGGGGISVRGAGTAQVLDNVISGNRHGSWGGGISLFAAGTPTISGNTISNNVSGDGGGGMWIVNHSDALITNNLIVGNHADGDGGGVYWAVGQGYPGPSFVNNTVADNTGVDGSGIYSDGFDTATVIQNNVVSGSGSGSAVECAGTRTQAQPVIEYNDVFNPGGPRYGGRCTDQTGQNGNIAADPLFVASGKDYRPQLSSPLLESGLNAGAPSVDIDGNVRPYDADRDGAASVDIGADELAPLMSYRPLSPGPPCCLFRGYGSRQVPIKPPSRNSLMP